MIIFCLVGGVGTFFSCGSVWLVRKCIVELGLLDFESVGVFGLLGKCGKEEKELTMKEWNNMTLWNPDC